MTATRWRAIPPTGTEVLLRQIDHHLAALKSASQRLPAHRGRVRSSIVDLRRAERIAAVLRRLVMETAHSSAAEWARVRAAVHYFVLDRTLVVADANQPGTRREFGSLTQLLGDLGATQVSGDPGANQVPGDPGWPDRRD